MTPNKNTEMEERLKRICAMIFMSPPLDEHKIGDIRPKLDWQVKEIMQAIHSRDMEITAELEKMKYPESDYTHVNRFFAQHAKSRNQGIDKAISLLQEETK